MKIETSAPLNYTASPLKVVEPVPGDKTYLKVVKTEKSSGKQSFSFSGNTSINEASNWDASWFANYE